MEVRTDAGVSRLDARCAIASGHKIALVSLAVDLPIIKYGEEIGRAQAAIETGDWIHLHNVYCRRDRFLSSGRLQPGRSGSGIDRPRSEGDGKAPQLLQCRRRGFRLRTFPGS